MAKSQFLYTFFSGWSCNCHGWDVSEGRCRQEREVGAQGVHQRNDGSSRHIQDHVYQEHWCIVGTNVNPFYLLDLLDIRSWYELSSRLSCNLKPNLFSPSDYFTTWNWTRSLQFVFLQPGAEPFPPVGYFTTWSWTRSLQLVILQSGAEPVLSSWLSYMLEHNWSSTAGFPATWRYIRPLSRVSGSLKLFLFPQPLFINFKHIKLWTVLI